MALLLGTGQPVLFVPGRLVNRMAGAFPGEGKTDAKDARTVAETARLRDDLTAVAGPDEIVAEQRILVEDDAPGRGTGFAVAARGGVAEAGPRRP